MIKKEMWWGWEEELVTCTEVAIVSILFFSVFHPDRAQRTGVSVSDMNATVLLLHAQHAMLANITRHTRLYIDTKLFLTLSYFIDRAGWIGLLRVPQLPGHADIQRRRHPFARLFDSKCL